VVIVSRTQKLKVGR